MIAIVAGIMMSFFFRFIASSMDLQNFECPEVGKMTPYTAMVIFSIGIFTSNFIFNTAAMRRPFVGTSTSYGDYFAGSFRLHAVGILGGIIWGIGNLFSLLATEKPVQPFHMDWDKVLRWWLHSGAYLFGKNLWEVLK